MDKIAYLSDHDEVVETLVGIWRSTTKKRGRTIQQSTVAGVSATAMYSWEGGVSPTLMNACKLARVAGYRLQVVPARRHKTKCMHPT